MKNIVQKIPLYWLVLWAYMCFTLVVAVFQNSNKTFLQPLLEVRGLFLLFFVGAMFVQFFLKKQQTIAHIISWLLAYAFLGFVYKETALLNQLFFDKIDPILINIDQKIFGFQPAIEFSKNYSSLIFSELMFFGYFFYYLMPLIVVATFVWKNNKRLKEFCSLLIASFVVYYLIFIFLPAEGPQFHFSYPNNYIDAQGIFGTIVKMIQDAGEAPTAAFPSSHVGISVIVLLWLYEFDYNIFMWILPFVLILFFSTVYIKAHYAIDVLAGICTGMLIYLIVHPVINLYNKRFSL